MLKKTGTKITKRGIKNNRYSLEQRVVRKAENVWLNENVFSTGSFSGTGANTLVPERYDFDGCAEAYLSSVKRRKKEKADVFWGILCGITIPRSSVKCYGKPGTINF